MRPSLRTASLSTIAASLAMLMAAAWPCHATAQTTASPDDTTISTDSSTKKASTSDSSADSADPSKLIDADLTAVSIELRQTPSFSSIVVKPVGKSGNSKALVRILLDDQSGLRDLHAAIRRNDQLMTILRSRRISVDDVVSISTDRNDNAIVFVKG